MNYDVDTLERNFPLIQALLNEVPQKVVSNLIGITSTTLKKYSNDINLLYKAPYHITNNLIIEAIKYNHFTNSVKNNPGRDADKTFAEFSKKCLIIGNTNNNLLSAKILLSEKYLIDNRLVLKQISDKTDIPYPSLKSYQSKRIDLNDASWRRVQILAQYKKAIDLLKIISNSIIEKMLQTNEDEEEI